ncbi:MAG: 50S ribosomal protein L21, partial [Gammaproteobacteria bacterium]
MYAVIATGGKQYRVTKDAVLRVEKLDAEPGATVEFGEVLLVGEGADVKVGKPTLKGGKVLATVVRHGKGAKVSVVKFKRRAHYLRQKTHRQPFTELKVTTSARAERATLSQDLSHGTQKGRRQHQERARFALQAPRREALRGRAR